MIFGLWLQKISFFGFDFTVTTPDQHVFSFISNNTYFVTGLKKFSCLTEILSPLYSFLIFFPGFVAGRTSFARIIERAMTIVEESGGRYHVLLIISDGQITKDVLELELELGYKHSQTFI